MDRKSRREIALIQDRAEALAGVTAKDPTGGQSEFVRRPVTVKQALGNVEDVCLAEQIQSSGQAAHWVKPARGPGWASRFISETRDVIERKRLRPSEPPRTDPPS
jgi:hypothetical protein